MAHPQQKLNSLLLNSLLFSIILSVFIGRVWWYINHIYSLEAVCIFVWEFRFVIEEIRGFPEP